MGALKEVVAQSAGGELDEIFQSDAYSIDQPFFQILQEGYAISSSDRLERFNAVRKRSFIKSIMAKVGAFLV